MAKLPVYVTVKRILHYLKGSIHVPLAHNPVLHARTTHLELDLYFLREKVLAKALRIQLVPA